MTPQTIRLPWLHDHHSHPLLYASFQNAVCLESVTDLDEARKLLRAAVQGNQTGKPTLVYGWRSNLFSWDAAELNDLGSVAIFNLSLHQLKLSQQATEYLVDRYGDDVKHVDDAMWYEHNFRTVLNWFANLNATSDSLLAFFRSLQTMGVGSCEELLLVDQQEIELFSTAGLTERTRFWAAPDTYLQLNPESRDLVHGLKLFTDGAFGARTAAISQPYLTPSPECPQLPETGLLVYSDEELRQELERCLALSPNLAIHAIGDVAIKQTIVQLEQVERTPHGTIRIEHAQLIDLELARRAKAMGIILSMQPNFNDDSIQYSDRLPREFCQINNPFRMLIDQVGFVPGVDLIFGSDGMPHGLTNAATQCFITALPHQRLSPEEFIAAYTNERFSDQPAIELTIESHRVHWRRLDDR